VRGRTPKERGGARSWGKDSFLPPNSLLPSPPLRRAEMARISRNPRHLGASSPSGNVRGECRGWSPLDRGRKIVECKRHNIEFVFSFFCPPRIPPKQKEEQMENSSPNPSFSICDIQIQKQISQSFGKSFPQKIVLPKLRPPN